MNPKPGIARAMGAFLLLMAGACSSNTDPAGSLIPTMVPAGTLEIDLSFFGIQPSVEPTAGEAESHYLAAAAIAATTRDVVGNTLAVPLALLRGVAEATADRGSGGYHFRNSVVRNDVQYAADLFGRIVVAGASQWEMRATSTTSSPPLDNFLWFTGTRNRFLTDGEWHVFDASTPAVRKQLLRVAWTSLAQANFRVVAIVVDPGSSFTGDRFEFESSASIRRLQYFDASAEQSTIINWNVVTNVGDISTPSLNNGVKSCWRGDLANTPCNG